MKLYQASAGGLISGLHHKSSVLQIADGLAPIADHANDTSELEAAECFIIIAGSKMRALYYDYLNALAVELTEAGSSKRKRKFVVRPSGGSS